MKILLNTGVGNNDNDMNITASVIENATITTSPTLKKSSKKVSQKSSSKTTTITNNKSISVSASLIRSLEDPLIDSNQAQLIYGSTFSGLHSYGSSGMTILDELSIVRFTFLKWLIKERYDKRFNDCNTPTLFV